MFYATLFQISEVWNHIKCSHIALELHLINPSKESPQKTQCDVIHSVFIWSWLRNTHLKNTSAFSVTLLDIVTAGLLDATYRKHNFPIKICIAEDIFKNCMLPFNRWELPPRLWELNLMFNHRIWQVSEQNLGWFSVDRGKRKSKYHLFI